MHACMHVKLNPVLQLDQLTLTLTLTSPPTTLNRFWDKILGNTQVGCGFSVTTPETFSRAVSHKT